MSLLSLARAAADPETGSRVGLVAGNVEHTFADLAAVAARLRAGLAREGVAQGSRVAVIARNELHTVALVHALLDLGAILVPIHPRLTEPEAAVVLADAQPALTIREDAHAGLLRPAPAPPLVVDTDPGSTLALVYTSGTTGKPKGAALSRRAFLASAAASAQNLGFSEDDRWLLCMPVCHVGGLSILTRCLIARRAVILEPRFDPAAVLAAIGRHRATLLSVVPTMLHALLEQDREGVLARLRAVLVGGAAAPFPLLEACEARGVRALTTYGLTEACSQVTAQRPTTPPRAAPGSGHALPGIDLRVVREGGVGRIQVRGPTLMDGYFAGPDRAPLDPRDAEGWLDTGDLGELDEQGALHVHARRTDLIVTGGENVYPVEVEQRLEALPGVRRALVFGVPDERWGQIVAAALELAPGVSLAAIEAPAASALAPHKRPRLVCAAPALPVTASGKLERAGAAARYKSALQRFRVGGSGGLP